MHAVFKALLHVGIVGSHVVIADNGINTAVFQLFHGQAHILVFLDLGANIGLFHDKDAGGADLAAHLEPHQVSKALDGLALGHNHGLHHVVLGITEKIHLLAFLSNGD